jgi:hypothetical protein
MRAFPYVAACLLLGACATEPRQFWTRTDGRPVVARQFEVDRTICRGRNIYRGEAITDVYTGCMAERGYFLKAECPPTANGDCVPTLRPGENYQFPR